MTAARGDVGIADVITAWGRLGDRDDDGRAIAALLGFELAAPRVADPEPVQQPAPQAPDGDLESHGPVRRITHDPTEVVGSGASRSPGRARQGTMPWRRTLRPSGRSVGAGAEWDGAPMPPEEAEVPPLPFRPLLAPHLAPRILEAAVVTDARDGLLDTEALVAMLARRHVVDRLPRRPRPSLLRGVQVLVDHDEPMPLFDRDVSFVLDVLRATAGRASVQALDFAGTPLRGTGAGPVWTWAGYEPPAPGTPVLVLTAFGEGRAPGSSVGGGPEDWRALGEVLHRRGSPVVALVPLPPQRWPADLPAELTLVPWDRSTTVSVVRRARGRHGHRR